MYLQSKFGHVHVYESMGKTCMCSWLEGITAQPTFAPCDLLCYLTQKSHRLYSCYMMQEKLQKRHITSQKKRVYSKTILQKGCLYWIWI